MRFRHYALVSALLTCGALAYGASTRKSFYSTAIYMTTHKLNIVVLVNLCFLFLCLLGMGLKRVFLGVLTRDELEELVQQSKYAITETMLALTIFREELSIKLLVLFTALLFIKIFHMLAAMRVEALARSEIMNRWQHVRLVALFAFLALIDWVFVIAIAAVLLKNKTASVLLLFGFEYLILSVSIGATFFKYVLLVLDARWEARGHHWNNKNTWMFYLELCGDLLRLCLYLLFFLIICHFYGLPLHLIRELGLTFFNLRERIVKFLHYRRITKNMHTRFPDATAEEIEAVNDNCIVCREDMQVGHTKKLPCGHMFHLRCLQTWLERSQSCPTCRHEIPVNAPPPPPPNPPAPPANANAAAQPPAGAAANAAAPGGPAVAGAPAAAAAPVPRLPVALPPELQAHLEALGMRVASDASQPSASPLHPLFGSTPLPAPHSSPTSMPMLQFPSPLHGQYHLQSSGSYQHPLMRHSPMTTTAPAWMFPAPPVPPPPAHMFPLGPAALGGAASSSSSTATGSPSAPSPPLSLGLSASASPHAEYIKQCHTMLLQHHAEFQAMLMQQQAAMLRQHEVQMHLLQQQQREMEKQIAQQQQQPLAGQQPAQPQARSPDGAVKEEAGGSSGAASSSSSTLTQRKGFSQAQ